MADVAAATHDKAGPSKSSLKAQHHLSSGALSGFASSVCLQPLDLLKTRLQQGQGKGYEGSGVKRRKLASVVKEVIREDGVRGLWRGTVPTIVRNVPGVALYFYSLSTIRTKLSSIPYFAIPIPPRSTSSTALPLPGPERSSSSALVKLSSQGNMLAGAIGRTSVGFVLNPITVLKARYESSRYNEYRSLWGSFRLLLATNGVKGLFQGATATAARDAPYAGMSLVFYEKGKDSLSRLIKPEWGVPNAVLHSLSASMAACMATFLTSPADCVKTRMQVDPKEHPTIRKAIGRIYTDRGLSGFFSGSTLRISRKAASGAIAWSVYEAILLFLRDRDLASFAAASASSSSSTGKPLL